MTKKIALSYTQGFVAREMPYCFYLITEIEDILSRLDDVSWSMEENSRFLVWEMDISHHWNLERERAWNLGYEKMTSHKKPLARQKQKAQLEPVKEACGVYFSFCNFVFDTTSNDPNMQWCPCHGFRLQFGTFPTLVD